MNKHFFLILTTLAFLSFNMKGQTKFIERCKWGTSGFHAGYKSFCKVTSSRVLGWTRVIAYNRTLPELYAMALSSGKNLGVSKILFEIKEPQKLSAKYCFELHTPPDLIREMFPIMVQILDNQHPEYISSLIERDGKTVLLITDNLGYDIIPK